MGANEWREVSSNALTREVKAALPNIGWTYVSTKGRAGGSWFVKAEDAALRFSCDIEMKATK